MAINVVSTVKSGVSTAGNLLKRFVIPIFIGTVIIGLIVGLAPVTKKFLVADE